MLRLVTFGGCFLERDGARLDGVSGQRKALALLALLAAAGEHGLTREAAAAYLWPESDEVRAPASLKQLVHSLRQQLGAPDVLLGPAVLRLNPDLVTSDVAEFRRAIRQGDLDAAVALHAGPFLDGFVVRGADAFERWAAAERTALAADHAQALEALAGRAAAAGDTGAAVRWWRRRQAADPLSGRAAAGLMRALDAAGDRAGALRHAQLHDALLRQEVGPTATDPVVAELAATLAQTPHATAAPSPGAPKAPAATNGVSATAGARPPDPPAPPPPAPPPPAPATSPLAGGGTSAVPIESSARTTPGRRSLGRALALAAGTAAAVALGAYALRRGDADGDPALGAARRARAAAVAPANRAPRRSVAVLPFANISGDPANEPFADGLTDELIGALGRVAALKVAPRTSTFALKGRGLDVRTVADTLGVATALEGSVRRAGNRLRITVALVSAAENRVLWSETYDRELEDVFAIQEEIARAVVGALQITLAAPAAGPPPPATADLAAYELYLKGQFFRNRQTGEALQRAVQLFEQAIARDPGFARAYAGLADSYAVLALFGNRPPREAFPRARTAAATALRLDSTLAAAHGVLGHIAMVYDWDWEAADRRFDRAIALDPAFTSARLWRGISLLDRRRFDEAAAVLEQARAADPLSVAVHMTLGRLHVSAGRPDQAIPFLRGALELNPGLSLAHQQLGHAYLQKRLVAEARTAFERAAELGGVRDSAQLAYAYAVTGRRGDAQSIVRTLLASAEQRYLPPFGLAVAYVGLGDPDAAFRWLERGHAERAAYMDAIAITPALAPLHGDPRWARLVERMGLGG